MPLHTLRHTAAASWLTTRHSLIFVARQLGHRSITTTEQHYGHLELNLFTSALTATDAAITRAATNSTADPRRRRPKCVPGLLICSEGRLVWSWRRSGFRSGAHRLILLDTNVCSSRVPSHGSCSLHLGFL